MPGNGKKKKVKAYTHQVQIKANANKNEVKVFFSPSLKRSSLEDRQTHVNVLISGMDLGLKELMSALPMLRPATELEREKQVYVYKDEEADNLLYKTRKSMYDTIANIFQETLGNLFPDVEYIDVCTKNQQELIFEMSKEEAEAYQEELAQITETIRTADHEEIKEEVN